MKFFLALCVFACALALFTSTSAATVSPNVSGSVPSPVESPVEFPIGHLFPGSWVNGVWTGYNGALFDEPGPPYPTGQYAGLKTNSSVTLKAGTCSQVVTTTIKAGGTIKFSSQIGEPNENTSFHWLTTLPTALQYDGYGIDNVRIYAGFYDVIVFPKVGHFTLPYASSDCPLQGSNPTLYDSDSTVISVTVTK